MRAANAGKHRSLWRIPAVAVESTTLAFAGHVNFGLGRSWVGSILASRTTLRRVLVRTS